MTRFCVRSESGWGWRCDCGVIFLKLFFLNFSLIPWLSSPSLLENTMEQPVANKWLCFMLSKDKIETLSEVVLLKCSFFFLFLPCSSWMYFIVHLNLILGNNETLGKDKPIILVNKSRASDWLRKSAFFM